MTSEQWVRLAEALAAGSWIAVAFVVLRYLSPILTRIQTVEEFSIKIGDLELSAKELGTNIETIVEDLCRRITVLEESAGLNYIGTPESRSTGGAIDVLWVDSHPENDAFVISALKEHGGFNVAVAGTTRDALDYTRSKEFEAVVTSIERVEEGLVHKTAGLSLIKSLKSLGFKGIIIVYCGRQSTYLNGAEAKALGAEFVTHSPSDIVRFLIRKFQT